MVGRRMGQYEVLALVGAGGMGSVWKAKDTRLGRHVAIKTVPAHFDQHDARLVQLEQEAKLLALLNHPNIAVIHGLEEEDGTRFLVLEFVEGETLSDRLKRGAIPLEESLRIARQIADALEAAHEKGIIHRDLKPANIQLTEDGTVKVLDFGVAKALAPIQGNAGEERNVDDTHQGMILGTAAYMAPEQARGRKVDRRADIWSFGVVLYEMVTGKRPYLGADSEETISSVLTKEPDFDPVPVKVRRLLRKCLEKDVKNRLRDIADAWELVDNASITRDVPRAQIQRQFAIFPWTVAVLAVIVLLSSLWLAPRPPEVGLRTFPFPAPPGTFRPLSVPAISDEMLAFPVIDSLGVSHIYVKRHDEAEGRTLPGTEGAGYQFWSPSGTALAFIADQRLLSIDIGGGPVHSLMANVVARVQGAWSRNNDILVRTQQDLVRISPGSGTPELLANSSDASHPYFLRDGRRFLVLSRTGSDSSIQLASLDSEERIPVLKGVTSAPILASTPTGKVYLFFQRDGDLLAVEFNEALGAVRGEPGVLVPDIVMLGNPAVRPAVGVSPSGEFIAYQKRTVVRLLTWVDRQGHPIRMASPEMSVEEPRLSPDQSWVAGGRWLETGGADIWVIDPKGSGERRITPLDDPSDVFPVWSPDSSLLAYKRGDRGIYKIRVDGSGEPGLLIEKRGAIPTSWRGQELLFTWPRAPKGNVYLFDVVSQGTPKKLELPFDNCHGGQLSPDGNYVALDCRVSGRDEVYVQRKSGGKPLQVSMDGGRVPRWNSTGTELFFIAPNGDLMAAKITLGVALSAQPAVPLFNLNLKEPKFKETNAYVLRTGYDVTADGQQFLILSDSNQAGSESDKVGDWPITVVQNWWLKLEK